MENILNNPTIFTGIILWELIWKGFALWKAAKRNDKYFFAAILVLNTVGLLPIVYILVTKYLDKKATDPKIIEVK